jgi:phage-related protein (TIGR01555 family)
VKNKKQLKLNLDDNKIKETKTRKITQQDKLEFFQGFMSGIERQKQVKHNLKNIFKEPLVINQNGETKKASAIYDSAMPQTDKYRMNDNSTYNPYSTAVTPPRNFFNNLNSLLINNFFLGYGELSLLQQNPIISNICAIRSDEIIAKWIKFNSVSDDTNKSDKIKQLEKWFIDKKIKNIFKEAIVNAFLFGGCQIYIKLKNDNEDTKNGQKEREQPLIIDKLQIDKGSIEYLKVIEPIWYTAIYWQSFNPLLADFYKPEKYTVLGNIIHQTRMLHFKYKEVPDILKPTYMFNGIPLSQEITTYLMGFEQSRINLNKLIAKSNHFKLGTDLEAIIDEDNGAYNAGVNMSTRIELFNKVQSVTNVVVTDYEKEDFENISVNVTGLDKLMNLNLQYVCSVARIPVNKLFQESLSGLNTTGNYETDSFHDTIREDRANIVNDHLEAVMRLAMLDTWGDIDEDINWEWLPLKEAGETEQSQIRLNNANEIATLVNAGVIEREQAVKKLQSDKKSGWNELELVDDIELNIDENE